jgi:hypothetical protein
MCLIVSNGLLVVQKVFSFHGGLFPIMVHLQMTS